MTFRVRTALAVLLLTAVTMGLALGGVWYRFVVSQRRQLDAALLVVAHREAERAASGAVELGDSSSPIGRYVGLSEYAVAYDEDGVPLTRTSNFVTAPAIPRPIAFEQGFDFDHDGTALRGVLAAVPRSGRRVLVATSRLDLEEDARMLARAIAIAFAVGCAWAALIAFIVARRLTREHVMIADVARRVAMGDTAARIRLHSSNVQLEQLSRDLNAMLGQLTHLVAAEDAFIAHAAHELRTPLTSLRLELEGALDIRGDRDDYQRALRRTIASARRLADLAEDLLQLARVKAAPEEDAASLDEALADAMADVAPVARTRHVTIDATSISVSVNGDYRGLTRVFRNVLEAAARQSEPGTRLTVTADATMERIVVRVRAVAGVAEAAAPESDVSPDEIAFAVSIARGIAVAYGGDVVSAEGGSFDIVLARERRSSSPDLIRAREQGAVG